MNGQAWAIVVAQYRSVVNRWRSRGLGSAATLIFTGLWYLLWCFFGSVLGAAVATGGVLFVSRYLASVLLGIMLYWQVMPVMMASAGFSLDIRKLLVYPVPHRHFFWIDVLLRMSTSLEALLLVAGLTAGALFNPRLPMWGVLALVPFIAFNLFVAAGIKELMGRALARKRVRELVAFVFVLAAALPQVMVFTGSGGKVVEWSRRASLPVLPWTAAANFVQGRSPALSVAALLAWAAFGYWFGRSQFERTLRFDPDAARSFADKPGSPFGALWDRLFSWPSSLLPDPIGALVEKEIRFLSRAPRFRLVFVMGFSFGLLIWVPMALRKEQGSFMRENFLTFVAVYSLLLLGDVTFWNIFGFDRTAAQIYHAVPVRFGTVLAAKNIAAVFYVVLELMAIAVVCALVRLPISGLRTVEAITITLVMLTYMLAAGNLTSTYYPRAVNPSKSTRSGGAGKNQFLIMLLFPAIAAPVAMAYVARWALGAEWAFFAALGAAAVVGACFYYVAMDSAVAASAARTEEFVQALSSGEGPIG